MAEKIFTRQNGDENAQSARELASKKSCVRFSCVRHRSDNPNRARECDRLESLAKPLKTEINHNHVILISAFAGALSANASRINMTRTVIHRDNQS